QGAYLVPTLTTYEVMYRQFDSMQFPDSIREKTNLVREASREAAALALRSGTPIAGGSDSGGIANEHGYFPLEVDLMMESGASIFEAIRICTLAGAKLCRIDDRVGSLEPGKQADILAVPGNLQTDTGGL